jgi:putative acetyltransferase
VRYSIVECDPQGPDALSLLQQAAAEAQALYPELHDPQAPSPTNPPTPARGAYFVAYEGAQAIGMGAHRPIDQETSEVRRMYVLSSARRTGLAKCLLDQIEAHARAQGFRRLMLETGYRQIPAMRLYEACGFQRIPPFGVYKDDPTSVCYEKSIAPASPSEA